MRRAATIAPTMMPMFAALLRPLVVAAAADEVGGGGAADVEDADVEDVEGVEEDVIDGVSWAVADLTAPIPDWAAPMKALRGLVVVAACARALRMLDRATRAGYMICLCIVEVIEACEASEQQKLQLQVSGIQ